MVRIRSIGTRGSTVPRTDAAKKALHTPKRRATSPPRRNRGVPAPRATATELREGYGMIAKGTTLLLGGFLTFLSGTAAAHDGVQFALSIGRPAYEYVTPPPVDYAPPPEVYYVPPPTVYYESPSWFVRYRGGDWDNERHEHHRGWRHARRGRERHDRD